MKKRNTARQADGRTKRQKNKKDNTCIDNISLCNLCKLFALRIFLKTTRWQRSLVSGGLLEKLEEILLEKIFEILLEIVLEKLVEILYTRNTTRNITRNTTRHTTRNASRNTARNATRNPTRNTISTICIAIRYSHSFSQFEISLSQISR